MLFFGVYLQWFPVAGYAGIADGLGEHLRYLFLPALSLGIVQAAYLTRMTRSSLLETLYKNYIQTARAKGLKEKKVVMKYALKKRSSSHTHGDRAVFGSLITGTIVTETLFNIPGLGMLTLTSINRRDVFVIQGVVLFVTLLYVLVNLVVDILYGFTDPKARGREEVEGEDMLMRRKEISAASEAIIREQRTLKKEKFLANPALNYRCGRIGTDRTTGNLLFRYFIPLIRTPWK